MHRIFHNKAFIIGPFSAALLMAQPAEAQRGGGGYVIFDEPYEEVAEPEKPKVELTPEEKLRQEEEAKRKAEEAKKKAEENERKYQEWRERSRLEALDDIHPFQDKKLKALTSSGLETFRSDGELVRWLKRLEAVRDERDGDWLGSSRQPQMPGEQPILIAAAMIQEEAVCTNPEECPEESGTQEIVTTGTRIASAPNVTNVQSAGVDEGDIIKQIGDFLITLQDGRLFVVNVKTMKLTDRIDVYRKDADDMSIGADWYDEMLVQDDHIIVTAYSYEEDATELSIFALDQKEGTISSQGVFLISSDDYYDVSNYASRIIGDKLVLYAPYGVDPDDIDLEDDGWKKPYVRRWQPSDARDETQKTGKPLFGGNDIFKPLLPTRYPTIHTISICPLGGYKAGKDLDCTTTGILGPSAAAMYVNADNIYLWNSLNSEIEGNGWLDECTVDELGRYPAHDQVAQGALYKLSVRGGDVGVVGIRGGLYDQYSMDEYRGRFRALSPRQDIKCAYSSSWEDGWTEHVALLDIPLSRFGAQFNPAPERSYTQIPAPTSGDLVQNRFSGDWLTYGSKGQYWGMPEDEEQFAKAVGNYAVIVPLSSPESARKIPIGHSVQRLELVGNDVVLNGYRDAAGLFVTFLKMDGTPRISDQIFLKSRYETENRSHAFNSFADDKGGSIMGIPTSSSEDDADWRWWRSDRSDLSFVTVTPDGKLADAGALIGKTEKESDVHEDYECDVSCTDWYGNARPIFTDGRIFGLMDTSLIEAQLTDGKISEKTRVDMTVPIPGRTPKEDEEE